MKVLRKLSLNALAIAALLAPAGVMLSGCDATDGPAEEAGENIDEAAEEVSDEVDDATDG